MGKRKRTKREKGSFNVGNIGSVGGDVFSGQKVVDSKMAMNSGDGNAGVKDDDTPSSVKMALALAAVISAVAAVAGIFVNVPGCQPTRDVPSVEQSVGAE